VTRSRHPLLATTKRSCGSTRATRTPTSATATRARVAQERALELNAPGDYTDWAITRLDRANCLVYDGDTSEAMSYATETFEQLSTSQREGIITLRGQEILTDVPAKDQPSAPVQQFKELLMLTSQPKKEKR
jgi:hypothetical protein